MTDLDLISLASGVLSLVFAAIAGYAVVSPRVHTGLVAMAGLAVFSLGSLGSASMLLTYGLSCADILGLSAATLTSRVGLVIAAAGWLLRSRRAGVALRRTSDWVDLDDAQRDAK